MNKNSRETSVEGGLNEVAHYRGGYIGDVASVVEQVERIIELLDLDNHEEVKSLLEGLSEPELSEVVVLARMGRDGIADDETVFSRYQSLRAKAKEVPSTLVDINQQIKEEFSIKDFREGIRLCRAPAGRKRSPLILIAILIALIIGVGGGIYTCQRPLSSGLSGDTSSSNEIDKSKISSSEGTIESKAESKKKDVDEESVLEEKKESEVSSNSDEAPKANDDLGTTNNPNNNVDSGNSGGNEYTPPPSPAHSHNWVAQYGDAPWIPSVVLTGYNCASCGWVGSSVEAVLAHKEQTIVASNYQGGCTGGVGEVFSDQGYYGAPQITGHLCSDCGAWQ